MDSFSARTKNLFKLALEEDIGREDKTTSLLVRPALKGKAVVTARESGIFCGEPVLRQIFDLVDSKLAVQFLVPEGKGFPKNKTVLQISGSVASILKAERTALNFLGHLSGIATKTRQFVERVKGFPVFVLDTRKTTPLWREIEKYAVRTGGGRNHRRGLYDALFVKENHRPYGNLNRLKNFQGQFEIEVRNLKELKEALKLIPRVILFDNFSPADLHKGVQTARRSRPEVILEASGGITLDNAAHYAAMGVDWISVGALTHSIQSIDFSLLIQ